LYGSDVVANGPSVHNDSCPLVSSPYALQFSFDAVSNSSYVVSTEDTDYATQIGVYDAACSLPALAHGVGNNVTVSSGDSPLSHRLHIVVWSADAYACGNLHLNVSKLS